jgi:ADP-heptose:LPS heptosyltransferase
MARHGEIRRPSKILLILDKCGPGEAIRVSPMIGAVRAAHPSAQVNLLVGEQAYPLFAHDRRFDKVVLSTLYGRRPRTQPQMRALLTAGALIVRLGIGYDMVITFLWGSSWLNVIARLVGRGRRIGYPHRFPALLTSRLGPYGMNGDIAANLRLLEAAGVPPPDTRGTALVVEEADVAAASDLLANRGRQPGRPLVVMHTGSDWACQQWLPERWAALADKVIDLHDADVVFTGLASEAGYVERIRSRMTSPSMSIAGETSLPQLAAVMSLATLCVSVDSAGHDIAQALGVPTTVLAGPTRPEAPAGRPLRVVNRTSDDLQRTILECQGHFPRGFCHDYSCPWAGLKHISVDMAVHAIAL